MPEYIFKSSRHDHISVFHPAIEAQITVENYYSEDGFDVVLYKIMHAVMYFSQLKDVFHMLTISNSNGN